MSHPTITDRPALGVVRSTPNKVWGSGITLDPEKAKPAPTVTTAVLGGLDHHGGGDDDDGPSPRRFLEKVRDEYNALWLEGERRKLAVTEPWLRRRIAAARSAITQGRNAARLAKWRAELDRNLRELAALPAKLLHLTTPAPAAYLNESLSRTHREPTGDWQLYAALRHAWDDGAWTYRLALTTPDDRLVADVDVAGAHPELAARLLRVVFDYQQERRAAMESSEAPSPLTLC